MRELTQAGATGLKHPIELVGNRLGRSNDSNIVFREHRNGVRVVGIGKFMLKLSVDRQILMSVRTVG